MDTFINWLTPNLDYIDLILTLLGFGFAIIEIRRTKSAVIASKEASEKTAQLLSDRSTISDIATIINGLRETQTALRGNRYEAALLRLQDLREKLHELRHREGFTSDDRLTEIQSMVFSLSKLQDTLEHSLSTSDPSKVSVPRSNRLLSECGVQISGWREEMHYIDRSNQE
jgi:DNA-binding transcriptional MerR regulator